MFTYSKAFSSFSVNDLQQAKQFYSTVLNLPVTELDMGVLELSIADDVKVLVYPKPDHTPATFTVLNFKVNNIDEAVDELSRHVTFEQYDDPYLKTDEKGICRGKPTLAWFKDPSGNFLSLIEE